MGTFYVKQVQHVLFQHTMRARLVYAGESTGAVTITVTIAVTVTVTVTATVTITITITVTVTIIISGAIGEDG